jgi:rsbT co-antagonist protein RsbR
LQREPRFSQLDEVFMEVDVFQALLDRFDISTHDLNALKECGQMLGEARIQHVVDQFYEWLTQQPEFNIFFNSRELLEHVKKQQKIYWVDFFEGVVDQRYVDYRVHIGEVHARRDLPGEIYFASMLRFKLLFLTEIRALDLNPERLLAATLAYTKLASMDTFVVSDQIAQFSKMRIAESGKAMMAMSTPVTSIWEGVLLLPLVGVVDSQRTKDIMEKVLTRIAESRARVFVMDISGVVTVDTAVADHFIRITKATQLMGCESVISGISPSVAQTLVELGTNVGEVRTTATLAGALQLALAAMKSDHNGLVAGPPGERG